MADNDYVISAKITADSSSFQKNIKDASTALGSFSKEIRSVTELIGSLFVSQKFVNFAKTSINAIEGERKEVSLLGTTLKTTGAIAWTTQQQLVDMSQALEKQSNYTSEQIERAQTVMLGFKTVTGDVFDSAMQNVLDMAEVMGMDLVSAVQTVGKALDDPVKGLGSLQRQGFAFSESQKAMLADMVATGKQAEAQKIILDELATTYGGAAKAGQNAFQQLDIAIGNLQKTIGSTLNPVVESITKDITALVNQFNSLDKGTQAFILTAGSLLTTLPLIIKGVQALKIALVSLQTSVPILLAISAAVVGISAAVAHVSKENEIDKFSRELSETQKSADNLLNAFAKGNPAKKLDADVTKELIKLYPELSGKIDEYGTSVEEAAKKVKEIATNKMVEKMALPIAKYKDLLSQAKDDLYESKRIIESGGKDSAQIAREYLEYYRANLAKANDEMKKINEQLKSVGKMLSPEGEVINIPVRFTPHADIEELKKSWKDLLREVFVISDDFSTGKQAANIFITKMSDSLKNDRRIAEALGESFDMAKVLEEQKSKILEAIKDILKSKEEIDKPFSIDELAKADTALGTLAKQYKALSEEIKQYTIANTEWTDKLLEQDIKILEKKRDNAVAVAKNEKKTEQEIYEIKAEYTDKINALQVKQLEAQRQTEIKKVKISKESLESQKAIIAQINQYYDTLIAAIKDPTVVINKSSNAWDDYFANFKKQAEDWNTVTVKMAEIGKDAMGDMFQQIGQDLANGGLSFENYSALAVKSISQVLVALSAQITALGVTHALTLDFAGAALAAAGAAAALVAAGTLSAVASNMTKTAEAAKDASTSIDVFIKSLREIWSGTVTSGSFVTSLTTMKTTVNELKKGVEETSSILEEHKRKLATFDERYGTLMLAWKGASASVYKDYLETEKYVKDFSDELDKLNTKLFLAQGELNNARMHTIENQEKEIELAKAEISVFEELYNSLKKIPKAIYGDVKYALKQNYDILLNEQKMSLLDVRKSLYAEMSNVGKDLGKTLVDGIKNGTKTADFMESIKDYIRNKIIELAVYTESFNDKLAEIGAKLSSAIASGMTSEVKELSSEIETLYKEATETAKQAVEAVGLSLKEEVKDTSNNDDVKKEFSAEGTTLGETFISSLISGAKKEDFSKTLGSYMKEQLIRAMVYTESFKEQMDVFGKKLVASAGNESVIKDLKKDIESLFADKSESIQNMTAYIDTLFKLGEVATDTESKFKAAMKSFKDSVADLGGDIANNFVSSLSGGLNVDSALLGFKKFLRDYIIKAYVFTDSMKGEIEKIGSLIGKTLDGSISGKELNNVANAVKATYGKLADSMKTVDTMLDSIFGKEAEKNVSDLGGDIASNFISSLNSGLDLDSALISFKKFIRNYVVQASVYTESLKEEFSKIGLKVWHYVSGSYPKSELDNIKKQVSSIYGNLAESLKGVDEVLDEIFGKEAEKNVSDLGGDVAGNFISSLNSGLDLDSALISFKKFIRNYVIQSAVYTESLKSEMEKIGQGIADYIMGKNGGLETISNEFKKTYEKLAKGISKTDEYLDKIFGKEKEKEVKDTGDTITKELSKIESAIDSFKKTVSDLGGDIASNLIEGLSNGLSQSDFLTNMKNWIKKMLVQSVVYTESMKSQIEEIGKTISNAISGGFTTTSMHEIRRDLSYIFQAATSSMSKIDSVLSGVFDGYATGTTSALRGLHIVGECGPELVRFNGGERVYNNADTMKMIAGAGKTNNMSITFNNIKDTSAFAMMSQLRQYQRELAINGVL